MHQAISAPKRFIPKIPPRISQELSRNRVAAIWTELLTLANQPGVVNLGQGFPDYAGSSVARAKASEAMVNPELLRYNQYSLPAGLGSLQQSICDFYNKRYSLEGPQVLGPSNVSVVAGATEGLEVVINSVVGPGDEVIMFDPSFPWYAPSIRMAGGTPVVLEMDSPKFAPNLEAVRSAITPQTKALLLNSPHNPCGHCYTQQELEELASIACENDLTVISDEVYENVIFRGQKHLRIADQEGMHERTVTLCSASKLFSLTGWRVGWILAPESYMGAINMLHTATSYCAPTPLQYGIQEALNVEDGMFEGIPELIEGNAAILSEALNSAGFDVCPLDGGHFLTADSTALGIGGVECSKLLLKQDSVKVGAIPSMIFYTNETDDKPLVRFALCKTREIILEAAERLSSFRV